MIIQRIKIFLGMMLITVNNFENAVTSFLKCEVLKREILKTTCFSFFFLIFSSFYYNLKFEKNGKRLELTWTKLKL